MFNKVGRETRPLFGAQRFTRPLWSLRSVGQFLAIALLGLVVVAVGTACIVPPGTTFLPMTEIDWSRLDNTLYFAQAMTVALTFLSSSFAFGGDRRLGLAVRGTGAILLVLIHGAGMTGFWLAPWLGRSWMSYFDFLRFRQRLFVLASACVLFDLPFGAVLGLVLGTIAGLLGIVARRSPHQAIGLFVALILAVSNGPVQRFAFGIVVACGDNIRWWITSPSMTDPSVPASGIVSGAIAGALIAVAAMWRAWTRSAALHRP